MPKVRNIFRIATVLACAFVVLASTCLCGCLGLSKQNSIAATVNGVPIYESAVTSYIEGFREEDESRETDNGWSQYLSSNGYTSESFRTYVLNKVFIPKEVIRQQATIADLTVTDDELDKIIEEEKAFYENRYGTDTWGSVLDSFGYDEASWRESEMNRILRERLQNEIVGTVVPTQEQIAAYAPDIALSYNGKHSYYIAFNSYDDAEDVLDTFGGPGVEVSIAQFKKAGKRVRANAKKTIENESGNQSQDSYSGMFRPIRGAVNAGWSSIPDANNPTNTVYTNTLNDLQAGVVSDAVEVEDGKWVIILCDAAYVFEENDLNHISVIPAEIYEHILKDISNAIANEQFDEWLSARVKESEVVINDMPEGLPYDTSRMLK